jgi:hypothetical protein
MLGNLLALLVSKKQGRGLETYSRRPEDFGQAREVVYACVERGYRRVEEGEGFTKGGHTAF